MRTLFKWLGTFFLITVYTVIAGMLCLLPQKGNRKRAAAIRLVSRFSGFLLALLGIRVSVKHRERLPADGAMRLIVSNHLSYIDVFIISALMPSVFITSMELRDTVLLGPLARLSGSIFVERRKATGLKQEIGQISGVLRQGMPVALFPEGTTTNGDRVHQFKMALFASAVETHADILPLCLRYTGVSGEPLTPMNRDQVFYYGGTTFQRHLPRLMRLVSVDVEVIPLPVIRTHGRHSRKELAAKAHRAISDAYHG